MMAFWFVSRCIGITAILIWLVTVQCDALELTRRVSSNGLGVSINSKFLPRNEVAFGGPTDPGDVASPISDLAPRSGDFSEISLAPYVDLDKRIPQLRVSSDKIVLFGIAIGASITFAALICGTNPTACLVIGAGSVIVAWLAVFGVDGKIQKNTKRATDHLLLEPGDYHKINVGQGFYEMDKLLLPFVDDDNQTLADVRYHLDTLRSFPQHIIEMKNTKDGIASIRAHMPHSLNERNFESLNDENPLEDESLNTRSEGKTAMVKHLTYVWNRSKKRRYHKLGKRDERKPDGKELGKGLGKYIAKQRYKAYCVSFHDRKTKADVNKGTFYVNNGKGVSKHCEKKK